MSDLFIDPAERERQRREVEHRNREALATLDEHVKRIRSEQQTTDDAAEQRSRSRDQAPRAEVAAAAAAYDAETSAKAAALAIDSAREAREAPAQHAAAERALAAERIQRELAGVEGSFLARISPRRNVWPELRDEKLAVLDQRAADASARALELEGELARAEQSDHAELTRWHAAGTKGERPAPSASAVKEELERTRADVGALRAAAEGAAAARALFVEKNRARLVKQAADARARAHARCRSLVDELADAREDLAALRGSELWAATFPAAASGQEPPTAQLCTGLRKPVQESLAIGHTIQAARVFAVLRADADAVAAAATPEQRAALGETSAGAEWLDPETEMQRTLAENQARLRAGGDSGWSA